jgi:hypothetical protein
LLKNEGECPKALMRPTVYVETSVISYCTARPSRNLIIHAHQEITCRWWEWSKQHFELLVSELVILEAKEGDPEAAEKRLKMIEGLPIILAKSRHTEIADRYIADLPLPGKAARDALHMALASVQGVDYLITWNCTHIANKHVRCGLEKINAVLNLPTPQILTPKEMFEV